ncbi:MAG: DUF4290 domain-containing protein [Bacteroidales bacterium]|jgi:hypothetical protein|nr:DUF4290 domain-containing protein [Bacteroidales bacterium]OPZ95435.1 MAG: hypothetical protein BWY72_02112 [Bacteroidetes bacterium ADurb.Bin416]
MDVNELDYNTQLKNLRLPEYGRNIQRMIDHALTLEDREERTRCAQTIISIMGNLFPHLRDVPDFKHKLWDHLAIMSDFKLDIDYPYELVQPEKLASKPDKVPYSTGSIKVRHYGRYLEELLDKAMAMEEGPERTRLIELMANHMKKSIFSLNREIVEDQKIYDDLKLLSGGKVQVNEETVKLIDVKELNPRKSMPRQNQGGNRKNQK